MKELEQRALVMLVDVSSLASVRAFCDDFLNRFDRLDILILNAAIAGMQLSLFYRRGRAWKGKGPMGSPDGGEGAEIIIANTHYLKM